MTAFEYPREARFSCSQCGDCCRGWQIALSPAEAAAIAGRDCAALAPWLAGAPVTRPSRDPALGGRPVLAQREDGACVFLGDRSQCLLHERFGEDAKPLLCRMYPFSFHPLGGRVAVDVAHSCSAVSRGEGAALESRVPEWSRLLGGTSASDRGQHRLTRTMAARGETIWEFEHHLVRFLTDDGLGTLDRLRAALMFLKLGSTGSPEGPAAARFREAIASGIPKQLTRAVDPPEFDATQQAFFHQWLYLVLNPPPRALMEMRPQEREELARAHVARGEAFGRQTGPVLMAGRDTGLTFDAVRQVGAEGLGSGECAGIAGAFLAAKIVGQRFMLTRGGGELPLVEGARRLFVLLPMALWIAKLEAALEGAAEASPAHLRRAVRPVDRALGALDLEQLDRRQAEAYRFLIEETELALAATLSVLTAKQS